MHVMWVIAQNWHENCVGLSKHNRVKEIFNLDRLLTCNSVEGFFMKNNNSKLNSFLTSASTFKRVIVYEKFESYFDVSTIYDTFCKNTSNDVVIMEFLNPMHSETTFSLVCFNPQLTFSSYGDEATISVQNKEKVICGNPFDLLKQTLHDWRCQDISGLPDPIGGSVGFMSYDAVRNFEKIPDRHPNVDHIPDFFFQFYENMILIDHSQKSIYLSTSVIPQDNPRRDYHQAMEHIKDMMEQLRNHKDIPTKPRGETSDERYFEDISDSDYCKLVKQAQEYIKAGDAFQIVLSRIFYKPCKSDPMDIYRSLQDINPSPCMFLFKTKEYSLIGASPERLVSVKERILETMPIAGSRPRGQGGQDLVLEKELLSDVKELAEHTMLIDLARNDLGSISNIGSVAVTELKAVYKYSHIMHIVSKVRGVLKDNLDPLEGLRAVFPAGTLTGAPKIRAMEIIDELENSRRGIYGGAICLIDRKENVDSFIAIRFIFLKDQIAKVRAGAGIVFDSDPQKEANETRGKAMAQMKAILLTGEDHDHFNR